MEVRSQLELEDHLTKHKFYRVVDSTDKEYTIINNSGIKYSYPKDAFAQVSYSEMRCNQAKVVRQDNPGHIFVGGFDPYKVDTTNRILNTPPPHLEGLNYNTVQVKDLWNTFRGVNPFPHGSDEWKKIEKENDARQDNNFKEMQKTFCKKINDAMDSDLSEVEKESKCRNAEAAYTKEKSDLRKAKEKEDWVRDNKVFDEVMSRVKEAKEGIPTKEQIAENSLMSLREEAAKMGLLSLENSPENNGGATDYYQVKPEWKMCQDIIEDRELNFSQGNILKSAFTFNVGRHGGTTYERELNKIIYFAERELKLLNKQK
jgi:hypothetical protein